MLDRAASDVSAMLARMRSRRPFSQMPPLGTVLRDQEALNAIEKWMAPNEGGPGCAPAEATSPSTEGSDRR